MFSKFAKATRSLIRFAMIAAFLCAISWNSQSAHAQSTSLVSFNRTNTASGNYFSSLQAGSRSSTSSADGRFVVFASDATDLVELPNNFSQQIYVRDLKTKKTTLVSVNLAGTAAGNDGSGGQVMSADGRFVAFAGFASDLVDNDFNSDCDIFVRDLQLGTTTLVSVNVAGTGSAQGFSFSPLIDASGRTVVFQSSAANLVANDPNHTLDLFTRNLTNGKTSCVNVDRNGVPTGNLTPLTYNGVFDFRPVISANGRYVAFTSYINDMVANDTVCNGTCDGTNGLDDVFIRDLVASTTTLVSVNRSGTSGGNTSSGSAFPSISDDGKRVAFRSFATDLVTNDTTPQADIYVRDMAAGRTELVSVNRSGTNGGGNGGSGLNQYYPLISGNGRFVAFQSAATDLTTTKTDQLSMDVFIRDLEQSSTTLASANLNGNDSGRGLNVYSTPLAFSADGRFLVFDSNASNNTANDRDSSYDIFVRNLSKAETALVSVNRQGTAAGNDDCTNCDAAISADGRIVIFESFASDLVTTDTNNTNDVFWRPVFANNPLEDTQFFVTQHYRDFLNREPDRAGLAFWTSEITSCGSDVHCLEEKHINVSAAFFLSTEFQNTGYLLYRFHATSFSGSLPRRQPFLTDLRKLSAGVVVGAPGWEQLLETNKQSFAMEWVQRPDFLLLFPSDIQGTDYVNALFSSANVTPSGAERTAAISAFGSGGVVGRANALRGVVDSKVVYNKFYNSAFVMMQYFGYLQRNPDDAPDTDFSGYQFWLNKMNLFSFPTDDVRDEEVARNRVRRAEMVKAFLVSGEYRGRFVF